MKSARKRMVKWVNSLWLTLAAVVMLMPTMALAAGGGKIANIVIVADTRGLPAWQAWWANLYNESHLYFTLVTIIIIPVVGVIFGSLADWLMHFIGLDLKSRELAEH
jgi:hypothetical protein